MKRLLFAFVALFLVVGVSQAQDGKKMLKEAQKAIGKYNSDPVKNAAMLAEGMEMMKKAFEDPKISGEAKNYITKGKVFQEMISNQIKMNLLNPQAGLANPEAGVKAFTAFSKALEIAEKKGDRKDALKGLSKVEEDLNNTGVGLYRDKKYDLAFQNFEAGYKAFKVLKDSGEKSRLDDAALYNDHVFFTGVSAYFTDDQMRAKPFFEELYAAGTEQPMVYEALYKMSYETDKTKSIEYLNKGREMFPDDTGMLFAEINHYLAEGEMDILIEKLNAAQAKEPDNMSVVVTRGKVYEELHNKSKEGGDLAKADEYFNLALADYNSILAKDAENFEATYSIGALYYNKAAAMAGEINTLSTDYSKEGTAKYNAAKEKMDAIFGEALPFFEKAEKLDGEDVNTMIALKEIYARKNMFDKSNVYKEKIEAAQN